MLSRTQTRNGWAKAVCLVFCLLCLLFALVVTGCHIHSPGEHTGTSAHCDLCDLACVLVAVVALMYALLSGRVFHTATRLILPLYQRFSESWSFIRPPPVLDAIA